MRSSTPFDRVSDGRAAAGAASTGPPSRGASGRSCAGPLGLGTPTEGRSSSRSSRAHRVAASPAGIPSDLVAVIVVIVFPLPRSADLVSSRPS